MPPETAPAANEVEARTATGEIKDLQSTTSTTTPDPALTLETSAKDSTVTDPAADKDKSLLNKGDKTAEAGAPEKYEDFKVPEGFTLDKDVVTEAVGIFKEMNLSQAQAQTLMDLYAKEAQKLSNASIDLVVKQNEKWTAEAKADAEIGTGTDLKPAVKVAISKAIDVSMGEKVGGDFRKAIDETGLGNHPAIIRGLYALAKQLGEGTHVTAGNPSPLGQRAPGSGPMSAAKAMYPNNP